MLLEIVLDKRRIKHKLPLSVISFIKLSEDDTLEKMN